MSGSTIGTPFSPSGILVGYTGFGSGGLSLARYASIIGYSECAFFGISDPSNVNYSCRNIWVKYERDTIADYLVEAQESIEEVIGYPLSPRWFEEEDHLYTSPIILDNAKIIELGIKAQTTLGTSVTVSYATEPAIVSVPTTLTSVVGIHVFYPGTDVEIVPLAMSIAGGFAEIQIPKCRLIAFDKIDNPPTGWDGTDPTIYQATVDVFYFYTDTSDQADLITFPSACDDTCEKTSTSVCAYIENADVGIIRLGKPTSSYCFCSASPSRVTVNYRAGLSTLTKTMESAIVRLAHSRMPTEPCGCDIVQRLWKRDRNVPVVLDQERLNCPFGLSDGAWVAWKMALSMATFRMTEFAGRRQ